MEWKLTTLIENHEDTEEKYVCEHGFSILIEKMDYYFFFYILQFFLP